MEIDLNEFFGGEALVEISVETEHFSEDCHGLKEWTEHTLTVTMNGFDITNAFTDDERDRLTFMYLDENE